MGGSFVSARRRRLRWRYHRRPSGGPVPPWTGASSTSRNALQPQRWTVSTRMVRHASPVPQGRIPLDIRPVVAQRPQSPEPATRASVGGYSRVEDERLQRAAPHDEVAQSSPVLQATMHEPAQPSTGPGQARAGPTRTWSIRIITGSASIAAHGTAPCPASGQGAVSRHVTGVSVSADQARSLRTRITSNDPTASISPISAASSIGSLPCCAAVP